MKTTKPLLCTLLIAASLTVMSSASAQGVVDESKANCDDLNGRVASARDAAFKARMPEQTAGDLMNDFGIGDILASKINFFTVPGFDQIMDVFGQVAKMGSSVAAQSMGNMFSKMTNGAFGSNVFLSSANPSMGSIQAGVQSGVQAGIQSGIVQLGGNLANTISAGASSPMSVSPQRNQVQAPPSQPPVQQPAPGVVDRIKNWFR